MCLNFIIFKFKIHVPIMLLSRNSSVTSHEDTTTKAFANTNNSSVNNDHSSHDHIMSYDHHQQHHHQHHHHHLAALTAANRLGERMELCCNQCGNYVPIVNSKNLTKEELLRKENNFKCDKCKKSNKKINSGKKLNNLNNSDEEHSDVIDNDEEIEDDDGDVVRLNNHSNNNDDRDHDHDIDDDDEDEEADIGIDDDMDDDIDNEDVDLVREDDEDDMDNDSNSLRLPKVDKVSAASTTTLLKDNNSKPILKFSVSAILGDTREGVRVRNGEIFLIFYLYIRMPTLGYRILMNLRKANIGNINFKYIWINK